MKNKSIFFIISVFITAGLLFLPACSEDPKLIIDNPNNNNPNNDNPKSGAITGTITLIDVPTPVPQVSISVWGNEGNNLWESALSPIDLDSGNYTDIPWSIPIAEENNFFPSYGKFRLHIQQADGDDGYDIHIKTTTPYIGTVNANVGSLGEVNINSIILSGTINVTYENEFVPYVEIGINTSENDWIGFTRIDSPGSKPGSDEWQIKLPIIVPPAKISFRVAGYNKNNIRLFNNVIDPDPSITVSNEDIREITLDLGNISVIPENVIPLIENKWANGEIIVKENIEWYSFNVTAGAKYYLWWNDSEKGDNSKTLDIDVYAYDENKNSIPLDDNDRAWDVPVSFTASSTGIVYVRVRALNWASLTGTYAIVYSAGGVRPDDRIITGSETNPVPLTINVWTNDSIPSSTSGNEIWYYFEAAAETTYYIWWNDKGEGDGTKTLDIKTNIYHGNGMPIYVEVDSSWNTVNNTVSPDNNRPISFKAGSQETIKIKVLPFFSDTTGSFAIVYSTSPSRP